MVRHTLNLPGREWTYQEVHDLALRMQRRVHHGFRVGPDTARLVVDALFRHAAEHFRVDRHGFQVDVWTPDDTRILFRFVEVTDLTLAHAAFEVAATAYPDHPVTLRNGIMVLRQSRKRAGAA